MINQVFYFNLILFIYFSVVFHKIVMHTATDPFSGSPAFLIVEEDISAQIKQKRKVN